MCRVWQGGRARMQQRCPVGGSHSALLRCRLRCLILVLSFSAIWNGLNVLGARLRLANRHCEFGPDPKRSVGKRQDHICSALSASSRRCILGASRCYASLASTFARSAARKIHGSAVLAVLSLRLRCPPDRTSHGTFGVCRMRARHHFPGRRMFLGGRRPERALAGACSGLAT